MSEWKPLHKLELPPPFPRSYNRKKEFIMQNRDRIRVMMNDQGPGKALTGKRYYVNENDVYELIQEKMYG